MRIGKIAYENLQNCDKDKNWRNCEQCGILNGRTIPK